MPDLKSWWIKLSDDMQILAIVITVLGLLISLLVLPALLMIVGVLAAAAAAANHVREVTSGNQIFTKPDDDSLFLFFTGIILLISGAVLSWIF